MLFSPTLRYVRFDSNLHQHQQQYQYQYQHQYQYQQCHVWLSPVHSGCYTLSMTTSQYSMTSTCVSRCLFCNTVTCSIPGLMCSKKWCRWQWSHRRDTRKWSDDYWTRTRTTETPTCKTPVQSQSACQHSARMPFLSPSQQCHSTECRSVCVSNAPKRPTAALHHFISSGRT